ncbi:MAG TPA: type VI secretion system protein TssA [Vicinamibacterales bacterium]|jgi:type VI secretion system protein ImpA|nr:type VI secretion system protein TssA [Vicinamibacterales bacterium]
MSASWDGSALLEPISADASCGKSLEDSDVLAALDAYQIFGQTSLEPEKSGDDQPKRKEPRKSDRPPNWAEIRDEALTALQTSKDLRLLAYLGVASLRIEGIAAFSQALGIAAHWLAIFPTQVYPLVDEDALFRQNALNCFADPVAVIDGLRRSPLVSHRQHGRFSIRDVDLVSGDVQPAGDDVKPDGKQIDAAFDATALDELKTLHATVDGALTAIRSIDTAMRDANGAAFAPSFESLSAQFKKMSAFVAARMAAHPENASVASQDGEVAGGEAGGMAMAVGAIKSRQDAIRALEAAAEFFRRNEPSSPIPMFLERAKRLVSKDFLEVLADVAPDALPQARSAGGLRDE